MHIGCNSLDDDRRGATETLSRSPGSAHSNRCVPPPVRFPRYGQTMLVQYCRVEELLHSIHVRVLYIKTRSKRKHECSAAFDCNNHSKTGRASIYLCFNDRR